MVTLNELGYTAYHADSDEVIGGGAGFFPVCDGGTKVYAVCRET
jgi:hypothetical protein